MTEKSCIYLIHSSRESYSDKENAVADYILAHPSDAVHPSIDELASRIGVSVSTLLRFVKKLGYEGYPQFRIALATEALAPEARLYDAPVGENQDAVGIAFDAARKALELTQRLVNPDTLDEIARHVCSGGVLYLFGLGGSGLVARDAFHKLVRSGILCQTAEDFHLQLMLASQAKQGDLALVISNTGSNRDALSIVEVLKRSGCKIAAIVTYPRSPLAKVADFVLVAGAPGSSTISEAFSARIAHLAIVDALYIRVMECLREPGLEHVERMRQAIATRRI